MSPGARGLVLLVGLMAGSASASLTQIELPELKNFDPDSGQPVEIGLSGGLLLAERQQRAGWIAGGYALYPMWRQASLGFEMYVLNQYRKATGSKVGVRAGVLLHGYLSQSAVRPYLVALFSAEFPNNPSQGAGAGVGLQIDMMPGHLALNMEARALSRLSLDTPRPYLTGTMGMSVRW